MKFWITGLFGFNNQPSMKRFLAFILTVSGIIFAYLNPDKYLTTTIFIGAVTGLLVTAAITES